MATTVTSDLTLVRVWNVDSADLGRVKVATVEQGSRQPSMCEGCPAPCCKGMFRPILTAEEFLSRRFKTTLLPAPDWLRARVPEAEYLACIALDADGCPYHDRVTNRCKIWPDCPASCLSYDCREDTRPEIAGFAKERAERWLRP